ncbi:lipoate protein ligase A [Spiroplasma sp. TIUS-1]|uniref:lipoate--protein ligase n=1 Tax=Spiroplasma sp. TIUS-1 TaxID=216963 RepID=UPI001398D20C|nr:lipoate--protein ligase [Spiroplasma sp. TIUS-1]QHX35654.1 lipoate protein ligase A [Spiroplasma sp. TIUS-1]
MYTYISKNNDPMYNLALEEYFVTDRKFAKENILFIFQNDNSIIVGRNQNVASEVNLEIANKDFVKIVRRNTGGGTVFHDLGNVNFSIIYPDHNNTAVSMFKNSLQPVIETLNKLGAPAEIRGKNDIVLNGKKISGNAMWKSGNRFLQHGTLLFNSNLDKIQKYLTGSKDKIKTKSVSSVKSNVTNINNEVSEKIDIENFKFKLLDQYLTKQEIKTIILDNQDQLNVEQIVKNKYSQNSWNLNKNSDFEFKFREYLENKGMVEIFLNINSNIITECKIYGDFLGFSGTKQLEEKMIGINFEHDELLTCLKKADIKGIFGPSFEPEDLLKILLN